MITLEPLRMDVIIQMIIFVLLVSICYCYWVCYNNNAEYIIAILPCFGTLYSSNRHDINIFSDNRTSAIELHESIITINCNTKMSFIGNNG